MYTTGLLFDILIFNTFAILNKSYSFWNFVTTYNRFFGHATTITNDHWIHPT